MYILQGHLAKKWSILYASVNPISHGLSDSVAPTGVGLRGPPIETIKRAILDSEENTSIARPGVEIG